MPIQKESLVDIAIERIKQHIAVSGLQPNDKLSSEKELTQQLQVSRTVVREALISLQSIGIVTIRPGGGVFINDPNFDSIKTILKHHYDTHGVKIRELIEIRKIIELGALRLIFDKQSPVDFNYLTEINESYYDTIIHKQDTREYDRLFHQYLMKATNNETYYQFSEIINEYFSLTKIDWVEQEEALIQSYNQHQAIINALKGKNLSEAQQIMTEHFTPVFDFIKQMEDEDHHGTN